MLKLIVNGDDFGLTETINEGILKSFKKGILSSTSIMANGRSFEHAVEIIQENPGLDVGIHLTLIEEKPILNSNQIPSLVKHNGEFYKNAIDFTKRYLTRKFSMNEIKKELITQIEKALDCGIKLSHIDSHQHIHMLPAILDITIDLAKKFNIPFIRVPKEKISGYMLKNIKYANRFAQLAVLNFVCSFRPNRIFGKTDHFAGFFNGGRLNKKNLINVIKNLPKEGICELMCHPGLIEKENLYSHWGYHSRDEMDALIDNETRDIIKKEGIILTSFSGVNN